MYVPDDFDGRRKLDESGLVQEDISSGLADSDNLGILQTQRFADFAGVTDIQQTLNHVVYVQLSDFILAGDATVRR